MNKNTVKKIIDNLKKLLRKKVLRWLIPCLIILLLIITKPNENKYRDYIGSSRHLYSWSNWLLFSINTDTQVKDTYRDFATYHKQKHIGVLGFFIELSSCEFQSKNKGLREQENYGSYIH